MSAEKNRELVRGYFQAITDNKPAEAWEFLAEDAIWTFLGHSPLTGQYTKDQLAAHTEDKILSRLKDGLRVQVKSIIAEGDKVAVEFESFGERHDGKLYNNCYHFAMTIKDGKLWRCTEYLDTYHYVDVIMN